MLQTVHCINKHPYNGYNHLADLTKSSSNVATAVKLNCAVRAGVCSAAVFLFSGTLKHLRQAAVYRLSFKYFN